MISHAHKIVFIHVPKTAGTSVEAALGHVAEVVRGGQDHRSLRQLQWPNGGAGQFSSRENCLEAARALKSRVRPHEYPANRLRLTRAQYDEYFKFAIVRNPWARTYSWYRNVQADALHRQRLGVPDTIDFGTFAAAYAGTGLLQPQIHWLVDFSGRIGVDFVCRFENLECDYAQVCRRAGLPELPLPHLNRGVDGEYRDAYDDRTRRLIGDRFRHEIDRFGFTFE